MPGEREEIGLQRYREMEDENPDILIVGMQRAY